MSTKETDYARIIGEFILAFGNLENVIHNTIIIVCKERYSLDTAFLPIIDNMLC